MNGTIRQVSCEQTRLREAIEAVRAHVHVAIVFGASVDESGQVPDEQVVKHTFEIISKLA